MIVNYFRFVRWWGDWCIAKNIRRVSQSASKTAAWRYRDTCQVARQRRRLRHDVIRFQLERRNSGKQANIFTNCQKSKPRLNNKHSFILSLFITVFRFLKQYTI